jgi:hypothetical protein
MPRSIVAGGADWTVYAEYSRYRAPGVGECLCFESPAIRRRASLPAAWEKLARSGVGQALGVGGTTAAPAVDVVSSIPTGGPVRFSLTAGRFRYPASEDVTHVMCDSQGVEWEYEVVGIGMSERSSSSETDAQEEFLFIVCWPRRPSETIRFRHIRADTRRRSRLPRYTAEAPWLAAHDTWTRAALTFSYQGGSVPQSVSRPSGGSPCFRKNNFAARNAMSGADEGPATMHSSTERTS